MTDIPRSVMEEASEIASMFAAKGTDKHHEYAERIIRIAERLLSRDKRAAEIADAYAHAAEIEATAGMAASKGVGSSGWIKDVAQSQACETAKAISKGILTYDTPTGQEDGT